MLHFGDSLFHIDIIQSCDFLMYKKDWWGLFVRGICKENFHIIKKLRDSRKYLIMTMAFSSYFSLWQTKYVLYYLWISICYVSTHFCLLTHFIMLNCHKVLINLSLKDQNVLINTLVSLGRRLKWNCYLNVLWLWVKIPLERFKMGACYINPRLTK